MSTTVTSTVLAAAAGVAVVEADPSMSMAE
jgi:hypothetical protein